MKWCCFGAGQLMCVVLVCLGTESSRVPSLDPKKTQQELEVMKGILRTTVSFASKEVLGHLSKSTADQSERTIKAGKAWPVVVKWGGDLNIGAIYLANQGAVFTIPVSQLRDALRSDRAFDKHSSGFVDLEDMNFDYEDVNELVQEQMRSAQEQMRNAQEQMRSAQDEMGQTGQQAMKQAPPIPPEPPMPPAEPLLQPAPPLATNPAPAPGATRNKGASAEQRLQEERNRSEKRAEMQKRLAKLQAKEKQRVEQQEASQAKFEVALGELKTFLVEALANHGDSMSIVKPSEYINLVLSDNSHNFWMSDADPGRSPQEIISVQKSVVSDYKAGRITMDEFKKKVVSYRN